MNYELNSLTYQASKMGLDFLDTLYIHAHDKSFYDIKWSNDHS